MDMALRAFWRTHGRNVMLVAVVAMSVLALLKLGTELHRLTSSTAFNAAIDLRLRYFEVRRWFAGEPVYTLDRVTYPPQAYPMLWPLLGWLPLEGARWLWACTSVGALAWLAALLIRAAGAETALERAFVVLLLFSMNAVGVTIGNGQLVLHILPALLSAILLVRDPRGGWFSDVAAATLLLFAAVKPSITAPFAWVVLFTARRVRPLVLTVTGYVLLTLFASRFQSEPPLTLIRQWLAQADTSFGRGYGDLQSVFGMLGLEAWAMPASILILVLTGAWILRWRRADPWILIGVAALVARMWTIHRVYDDVLIVLPMIALFRIAKRAPSANGRDVQAAVLLGAAVIAMLAPARLETAASPWNWLFVGGHVAVWLLMLFFLASAARAMPTGPPSAPARPLRTRAA